MLGELMPHFGERQPMDENIMLIVSAERNDRMTTESVRPNSENRPTTAISGEIVRSVIGRVWTRVLDIDFSGA